MPQRRGPVKKERYEILFEEINEKMDLVLEGFTALREQVERMEFRLGRVEQQTDSWGLSSVGHSNEIRRLQHDIQVLQHEIAKLRESLQDHLKVHAT